MTWETGKIRYGYDDMVILEKLGHDTERKPLFFY
jgi:hypothetical protein